MALLIRNREELKTYIQDKINKERDYAKREQDPEIRGQAYGCVQGLQIALSAIYVWERNEAVKENLQ